MKTTLQTISPQQAAKWLDASINRNNRPLRHHTVMYLADEISRGKWQVTHQGIAFAVGGRLLDGQHRLAAIVRAGVSVRVMVTEDMAEDTFEVIDCGRVRAAQDRIHLLNEPKQNAGVVRAIRHYLSVTLGNNNIPVSLIEDEFLKKADNWTWAISQLTGKNPKLTRAGTAAAFAIYHYVKPQMAQEFMDGFLSGVGLRAGSAILKLRTVALSGLAEDTTYWRCQAAMRAHLQGRTAEYLTAAKEDMMGQSNTSRLVKARSVRASRGAATKKRLQVAG